MSLAVIVANITCSTNSTLKNDTSTEPTHRNRKLLIVLLSVLIPTFIAVAVVLLILARHVCFPHHIFRVKKAPVEEAKPISVVTKQTTPAPLQAGMWHEVPIGTAEHTD
jgi:hypothetical protein